MLTDDEFKKYEHVLQHSVDNRRKLGPYSTDAPDILLALEAALDLIKHVRHLVPVGKTDILREKESPPTRNVQTYTPPPRKKK